MDTFLFAQMPAFRRPPRQCPGAEEAYWRAQAELPRPLRLLVSLASVAGAILLLVGVGQV